MTRRVRFVVTGRVQGVGFRASARGEAQALGLVGFVQNRRDGAVEGEAQGDAAAVAAFVSWLRHGPPAARVESVDVADTDVVTGERAFAVQR